MNSVYFGYSPPFSPLEQVYPEHPKVLLFERGRNRKRVPPLLNAPYLRFCLLLLSVIPHPFIPSPARDIENDSEEFMAGEGSLEERGLRPLPYSLPLLNNTRYEYF